jgi:hypothetical protein
MDASPFGLEDCSPGSLSLKFAGRGVAPIMRAIHGTWNAKGYDLAYSDSQTWILGLRRG